MCSEKKVDSASYVHVLSCMCVCVPEVDIDCLITHCLQLCYDLFLFCMYKYLPTEYHMCIWCPWRPKAYWISQDWSYGLL